MIGSRIFYLRVFYKKNNVGFNKLFWVFLFFLSCLHPAVGQGRPDVQSHDVSLSNTHTDTNRVNALLKTATDLLNKPNGNHVDWLKANVYAKEALSLSRQLRFYKGEGISYILMLEILNKNNDATQRVIIEQQAIAFFKKYPFPVQEIDKQLETGNYYNEKIFDGLPQKIAYYETVVELMKKTSPGTPDLARALRNLGNLHMYVRADEPKAVAELKESLIIYKANGNQRLQDIYSLLAGLLSDLDNYPEALKYGLLSIRTIEKFKDSSQTALAAYDNLGTLYYGLDDLDNAIKFHNKGLELARKTGNQLFILDITHDLSVVYSKAHQSKKAIPDLLYALKLQPLLTDVARKCLILSDLMSAYTDTRQYALAQKYVEPLLTLISQIHDDGNIAKDNARRFIITLFLNTRQYSKIPQLLNSSREYAVQRKQIKLLRAVELFAFKLDSAQQRYISAIDHYQQYKALNDSVSKRNQDKQIGQLQVQYETEKKNQQIGSLTRQTQLQKSAIQSQRLARNLLYAGVALLVLLLGISYSRYRIKQQANYELSEQKEEIDTQNESLKQLLTEREWLLKEVHHRVKNNLQIVISLLNSQSAYLKDPAMLGVLKESQNRMRSISLIHQKLYQGDNLSGIDMFNYIHELVDNLQESFDSRGRIAFLLDIDKITMDVSQAVPIGLILNEAITNSIKYAFKDGKNAQIHVMLTMAGGERMRVRIADNGCGLPEGFPINNLRSLGMNLMKGLSGQLGAEFELKNDNGVCIQITGKKAVVLSNSTPGKLGYAMAK